MRLCTNCNSEIQKDYLVRVNRVDYCSMKCHFAHTGTKPVEVSIPSVPYMSRFEPYFDETLKQMVYSYNDREKKAHEFRSDSHPMGFDVIHDNKKFLKQCKNEYKHREDIIHETYKKEGMNYPKGANVNWDRHKGAWVDRNSKEPLRKPVYSFAKR